MNSYSASSVKFLSDITGSLPIIAGAVALVAILMFTIRYYLSPDPESQKRVTWAKKFSQVCGAFLIIAVFLGTGFGQKVFERYTDGDKDTPGVNKDIKDNSGSSYDIGGTQYDLKTNKYQKQERHNNSLADPGDGRSNAKDTAGEREHQEEVRKNYENFGKAIGDAIGTVGDGIGDWINKTFTNNNSNSSASVPVNSGFGDWIDKTNAIRQNLEKSYTVIKK